MNLDGLNSRMRGFKQWYLLSESKQVITSMGYPEVISRLFYERFPKNAVLMAKWFKQEHAFGSNYEDPDWWRMAMYKPVRRSDLYQLTYLYEATKDPESYRKAAERIGLDIEGDDIDEYYLFNERRQLLPQIEDEFFGDIFFTYFNLIKDIASGKLTDLAPYKGLTFREAQHKYDRRNLFKDNTPIKVYPNGFKWIDAGPKCSYLGDLMSNCGSTGAMSQDPAATIIALFGPNNKPHVMVTYSPNQKRISGDQGAGSTGVKDKYHDYVIDLAHTLGVDFDAEGSKSKLLGIKYLLKGRLQSIEDLNPGGSDYDSYYRMVIGGTVYYTNGFSVVSDTDVRKVQDMLQKGELKLYYKGKDIVQTVLARANAENLHGHGVRYTPLRQFASAS